MKKTIVQILRAPAGGIRKHVVDILENLDRDKFNLIFISNFKESDCNLEYLTSDFNITCFDLPIDEKPSMKDLALLIEIYKVLKKKRVSVLHGHGAKGGLYARLLKMPLKAKSIYTPHGGSLHRVHGKLKNFLYDLIERMMVPLTDVFLFESDYSRKTFAENIVDPKSKSVVNYNGVKLTETKRTSVYHPGTPIKMASFGLLRFLKGHDIAIVACKLLKEKNIPVQYDIFGEGEFLNQLQELITKNNLKDCVRIHPYSNNAITEMIKYDFIIHPSRFESFGYVPVEAMAMGIPVIVSQEGGLKEVVNEETGLVNKENTPEVYCELISGVYNGRYQLEKIISAANVQTESNFSLKSMIERINKIYLTL